MGCAANRRGAVSSNPGPASCIWRGSNPRLQLMKDEQLTRDEIIERRRKFSLPGYKTLEDIGFDGPWITPIQKASKSQDGPVLVAKHWLDEKSVEEHRDVLERCGYLPFIPFNKVLDRALELAGMCRDNIYITQVFHLIPTENRSQYIPQRDMQASFNAITRYEVEGRTVIALGKDAERACKNAGVKCWPVPHPSARLKVSTRVEKISEALEWAQQHSQPSRI